MPAKKKLKGAADSGSDAPLCSPSSDTPETEKAFHQFRMLDKCQELERALRASLVYDAARGESIRYACFDDTPERLAGQPHAWIETVLQVAEEDAGENFRKLRDAALGLAENVKVVAPPPLESEGPEIERLKGGCPPTTCSTSCDGND